MREAAAGNPFWLAMNHPNAYHTCFAPTVAVRRAYYIAAATPRLTCFANVLVMMYSLSFVVAGEIGIGDAPPTFSMLDPSDLSAQFDESDSL